MLHAVWNALAKGARDQLVFLWSSVSLATVVLLPVGLLALPGPSRGRRSRRRGRRCGGRSRGRRGRPGENAIPCGGRGGGGVRPRPAAAGPGGGGGGAGDGDPGRGAGINQPAPGRPPLWPEHVVLAPERDNPDLGAGTRQACDDVGVESRAVDEPLRPHGEAGGGALPGGAPPRDRPEAGRRAARDPRGPELAPHRRREP